MNIIHELNELEIEQGEEVRVLINGTEMKNVLKYELMHPLVHGEIETLRITIPVRSASRSRQTSSEQAEAKIFEKSRKIEDFGERTQKETGEILDAIVENGMSFGEAVYILEEAIKELKEGEMELANKTPATRTIPWYKKATFEREVLGKPSTDQ